MTTEQMMVAYSEAEITYRNKAFSSTTRFLARQQMTDLLKMISKETGIPEHRLAYGS